MRRKATSKNSAVRAKPNVKKLPRVRSAPATDQHNDFIDDLMVASAQALGLTIDPAWRDGVKFNLRLVFDHAARVEAFPLPDEAEPAPVFHA